MQPAHVVTGKDLEKYMPHRFENVVLDKISAYADHPEQLLAEIEVNIAVGDGQGRDLFLVENKPGQKVYNGFIFPEIMAVGALAYSNTVMGMGHVAVFSTISNYKLSTQLPAGEKLTTKVYLKRGKGAFKTFSGKIFNAAGNLVAENDIMAFVIKGDIPAAGDTEKKKSEAPVATMHWPVVKTNFEVKNPCMIFATEVNAYDAATNSALVSFEYPKDHPLVKGHFPGNPIMMGICQWMSSGDALAAVLLYLKSQGKVAASGKISADVELLKADGTIVAEIQAIENDFHFNNDKLFTELLATKKCGFRDMVIPGTKIYQRLTNIQVA